jgi:hypothetical protein
LPLCLERCRADIWKVIRTKQFSLASPLHSFELLRVHANALLFENLAFLDRPEFKQSFGVPRPV